MNLTDVFRERFKYAETTGPCNVNDMLFYIERSVDGKEVWIGNKPVVGFTDTHIMVGWGLPVPLFKLEDYGKICHIDRAVVEGLLAAEQEETK